MVSDELLQWRTGTTNPMTQHHCGAIRDEPGGTERGVMLADPFVLHQNPSGVLQDGEHLSVGGAAIYLTGAKTNSEAAGKI